MLRRSTDKEALFVSAKVLADSFQREDTEEREKVDDYIGETMQVLGLDDWTDFL